MSPASSPDSPTAIWSCWLMAETMSALTRPVSTMRATSSVSSSVTRSPSRNSVSLPSLASSSPIWGPPPCTTTGFRPMARSSTMSAANECARASSTMALPPYFTTTVLPENAWMYGSASTRIAARVAAPIPSSTCGSTYLSSAIPRVYADRCMSMQPAFPCCSGAAGVLVDVLVGEVVGENREGAVAEAEVAHDVEVALGHVVGDGLLVVVDGDATRSHRHAPVGHGDQLLVHLDAGDLAGAGLGVRVARGTGHGELHDLGGSLGVAGHLAGEVGAHLADRHGE